MELCKVRFDGHHHLVQPYKRRVSSISTEEIIGMSINQLKEQGWHCAEKKDLFYNEWARENFPFESTGRKPIPEQLKRFYNELQTAYFNLLNEERIKDSLMKETLLERIFNNEELKKIYPFDDEVYKKYYLNLIYKFVDNA